MEPSLASAERTAAELVDWLLDGGMAEYVDNFFGDRPRYPEDWEVLRERLWEDCHDGDRYLWQPLVPLIESIYERQSA